MSHNFEVSYIGWSPAKGLWGNEFVHPVLDHIVMCREHQPGFIPDTLQITVRRTELSIIKEINSRLAIRTFVDCPNIPLSDIAYCTKSTLYNKVYVCLLVLGCDPDTGESVHLYVYRAKTDEEATRLINKIRKRNSSTDIKQRILDVERMLVEDGKISRSKLSAVDYFNEPIFKIDFNNSNSSSNCSSFNDKLSQSSKHITRHIERAPSNNDVVGELYQKLRCKKVLLLPPRDYDTIHRQHGNCNIGDRRNTISLNHLAFSNMR